MLTPPNAQRLQRQVRDLPEGHTPGERSAEQGDLGIAVEERLWNAEQLGEFLHISAGSVKKRFQRGQLAVAAKTKRPLTWPVREWLRWKDSRRTYV